MIGTAVAIATLLGVAWVLRDGWRWQRDQDRAAVAEWDRAREALRRGH